MYHAMSESERLAFLRDPVRPAMLSSVRADGRPHVAPIWYDVDGDLVVFTTGASTVKGRNLQRDPRVALCVHDDQPPYSFVLVEGVAEISDDREALRSWAARIGGRYMGAHRADEYGARNGVPGELLVRVTPIRASGSKDVAE
ncbi:MAG: PPOX class F420-dependent oxidoreductase [Acidimicrobiales bacterium]